MATTSLADSELQQDLQSFFTVRRRFSDYELPPVLHARMEELGERKEFLTPVEHAELASLVEYSEERTIAKLEVLNALRRLQPVLPHDAEGP